MNNIHI